MWERIGVSFDALCGSFWVLGERFTKKLYG